AAARQRPHPADEPLVRIRRCTQKVTPPTPAVRNQQHPADQSLVRIRRRAQKSTAPAADPPSQARPLTVTTTSSQEAPQGPLALQRHRFDEQRMLAASVT